MPFAATPDAPPSSARSSSLLYGTPRLTSAVFATSHGDVNRLVPTGLNCTEHPAGSATTTTGASR